MSRLVLASYKLRFHDEHVRAVPARDAGGCAFGGPGVDVRGEDARAILDAAGPVKAWLGAREPDVTLRSFSASRGKSGAETPRVLVTLEAPTPGDRPRVLRFDMPYAAELVEAAREAETKIIAACEVALMKRSLRA